MTLYLSSKDFDYRLRPAGDSDTTLSNIISMAVADHHVGSDVTNAGILYIQ